MKKQTGLCFLVFLIFSLFPVVQGQNLSAEQTGKTSPTLKIIIPSKDSLSTSLSRHRIAGHTEPQNEIFVNEQPVKVYATGAFVYLAELKPGKNEILIQAISAEKQKKEKKITFIRTPPLQETPEDVLRIEKELMLPAKELELNAGDSLEVRFKGTPGLKAYFSLGSLAKKLPMSELPPERAPDKLRGIYVGHYKVKPTDRLEATPVTFQLVKSFLKKKALNSRAKVSILPEKFPLFGKTNSPQTYVKSSLGEARLGGAQFGYLDKDVVVTIDGRVGDLYRVRFSPTNIGWIPLEFIDLLSATPPPHSLVNSIIINSEGKYDLVSFGLEARLPYYVYEELQPPKLNVELYGAKSNLTWITNRPTETIRDLTWRQLDESTLLLEIWLAEPVVWGYSAGYKENENTFLLKVRHPPEFSEPPASPLKGLVIAVDAGHGGKSMGAVEATGVPEKEINRSTADFLIEALKLAGAKVMDVRPADEDTTLSERIKRALAEEADLYISIHANSIGEASDPVRPRGTMTLYKYPKDREISFAVYRRLCETGLEPWGVVSSFNSATVKITQINTFLIEQAFMSHPEDEALLLEPEFRKKIAAKTFQGLADFYGKWREHYARKKIIGRF